MVISSMSCQWSYTTQLNFMAVVDALIPSSVVTSNCGCTVQYGGVPLSIWEYLLMSIDSLPVPLTEETSQLLDLSAFHIYKKRYPLSFLIYHPHTSQALFSTLSRKDRLRAINLLEKLMVPSDSFPVPYKNNPIIVQIMIDSLYQLTFFGYYSEWFGYGETRIHSPAFSSLRTYPVSWAYTGYPGPSFGYRDFRGFLLKMKDLKQE
ncbi:hypothetical protein [Thalassobacillus devorans]|uniref:hypothetical protein n=1 Tax=Thalassobacillus devorans TaxID=279813 RepID=UPI0004B41EB5|nr:hypothetical protein [Thalassobacillus devorans]